MNKIYVVGLGPGAGDQMTVQAKKVLDACPVIIGSCPSFISGKAVLEHSDAKRSRPL